MNIYTYTYRLLWDKPTGKYYPLTPWVECKALESGVEWKQEWLGICEDGEVWHPLDRPGRHKAIFYNGPWDGATSEFSK